jgi:hypothetical protein
MPFNYRKSAGNISTRRSRGKKATQFKLGHKPKWTTSTEIHQPGVSSASSEAPKASKRLVRLTDKEARDSQFVRTTAGLAQADTLAYTLRPKPEKEEKTDCECDRNENFIVNNEKMLALIKDVHASGCKKPNMKMKVTRAGLCVYICVKCSYCGFNSQTLPMSDTIQTARGPPAGFLNYLVAMPVLKSKIGMDDVATVLTWLNIKAPCKQTFQKKFNDLGQAQTELSDKQLELNQDYVANVMKKAGFEPEVDIQFDVAYTCRPQGGCEKSTQSFGALVEHNTGQKLPLAIAMANKHCRKRYCRHDNCSKTFAAEASIASSERVLLHRSLDKVKDGPLAVRSITTDSGTQSAKAIRDYYELKKQTNHLKKQTATHYKCFVHKLRALERHVRAAKSDIKSIPKKYNKDEYMRKLASCLRCRVRIELERLRKQSCSDELFLRSAKFAIENIMHCFSGDHKMCKERSRVCTYRVTSSYKHLPYGEPLALQESDKKIILGNINKTFDATGLKEVAKLFNTNACESLNASVFQYAPKTSFYARNFAALCHSAVHTRSMGPSKSSMKVAEKVTGKKISLHSMIYNQLKAKDRRREYDSRRKASVRYKIVRFYLRKRHANRALYRDGLYASESMPSTSAADHSYGLKV